MDETQAGLVRDFMTISNVSDEGLAREIMTAHSWNLESAVGAFTLGDGSGAGSSGGPASSATPPPPPRSEPARDANAGDPLLSPQNGRIQGSGGRGATRRMEGPIMTIPGISFLSNLLKATPHRVNRDRDARKFASSFTTQYGSGFPAFFDGSYSRAVATAHRSSKFLLVYLHSSLHDDSDQFVHDVLGNSAIQALIDSHMLMWAGQVSDVEAYELATDLNVSAFPCLSVLVCHSEREVLQADNIEGQLDPETVKARLELSISEFTPQITRGREEALRREQNAALREQQNREYQASEQAERERRDRRRQEELEVERQREEDMKAARLREEEEAHREQAKTERLTKLRAQLREEPDAASDVAHVRLQMPDGRKITRRWKGSDTINDVVAYLTVYVADNGITLDSFDLHTSYPKRRLDPEVDYVSTLEAVGLVPRGVLMVQDLNA